MKKKAMGHIEVILAFVLFIGFLFFGLYFFNPLSNSRVLETSLFYAFDEVIDNASSTILTYGISFNETTTLGAVRFPISREGVPGNGIRVETPAGNAVANEYHDGMLSLGQREKDFVYVRFGTFAPFPTYSANPTLIRAGENYSVASSEKKEVLNEWALLALNASYYADYENLREYFNLPRRVDFGAEITDAQNLKVLYIESSCADLIKKFSSVPSVIIKSDMLKTYGGIIGRKYYAICE